MIETRMFKFFVLNCVLSLCCLMAFAQVSLDVCYRKAQLNYPLIKQYDLIEKTKEYRLLNVGKGYLPQVMFSGKATYQSDVIHFPGNFPGIDAPLIPKNQYGATVDINQTIWDGGDMKSQKEWIRTSAAVDKKNVEVNVYSINERVNQLYFGILLADALIHQNQLLQIDLNRNYERIQLYVQTGMANRADVDAIKVELLKTKQSYLQHANTKKAYIEMLSKLIGEELSLDTEFVKPLMERPSTLAINRPESELFDAQIRNLEIKNKEIDAGLMPKVGLFVTGGYGNPGLNLLESGFTPYYIVGARLSWNIGNFYTRKNNRYRIETGMRLVETQRETFLFNTAIDVMQKDNSINNYLDQLKEDDEIIALRGSIKRASEAKMANGTLSGTDLARDINAEQLAMQDKILHEMQLLLAIYNLKFATNN